MHIPVPAKEDPAQQLSPEEKYFQTIEDCGNCQFTVEDIAIILQTPVAELKAKFKDPATQEYQRYYKGRYLAELAVRQSIFSLAKQGSSQAQELWMKLRDKLNVHEA